MYAKRISMLVLAVVLTLPAALQAADLTYTTGTPVYTAAGPLNNGAMLVDFGAQNQPRLFNPTVNPTFLNLRYDVVVNGTAKTGTVSLTMQWVVLPHQVSDNALPSTAQMFYDVQYSLVSSPGTFVSPGVGGFMALAWDWSQFPGQAVKNFAVPLNLPGTDSAANPIYAYRFVANRVVNLYGGPLGVTSSAVAVDNYSFLVDGTEYVPNGTFNTAGTIAGWQTTNGLDSITWVLPEPASAALLLGPCVMFLSRRRR